MATVIGEQDHLHIELTTGEKWAALRRTDLLIPWADVDSAERVAEPFRLVHGLRAPGLAHPLADQDRHLAVGRPEDLRGDPRAAARSAHHSARQCFRRDSASPRRSRTCCSRRSPPDSATGRGRLTPGTAAGTGSGC